MPSETPRAPPEGARYAVFFAPSADDPLWAFGSAVIGYDAASGAELPVPDGLSRFGPEEPGDPPGTGWRALTKEPRRYGFHGTLKAPFNLGDGVDEPALLAAAAAFAAKRRAFRVPRLCVSLLGGFVALVPEAPAPALDRLAAESVEGFEQFRAPLSPADLRRRLQAPLSERQRRHLDRWGYPYVFEDFRFHMTLTGSLPADLREPVRAALAGLYGEVGPGVDVAAVALLRQDDRAGPFRFLARCPFGA